MYIAGEVQGLSNPPEAAHPWLRTPSWWTSRAEPSINGLGGCGGPLPPPGFGGQQSPWTFPPLPPPPSAFPFSSHPQFLGQAQALHERALQQRSEAQASQDRSAQQRSEAQASQDRAAQQRSEAQAPQDHPAQQRLEAQALHDRPLQQRSEAQALHDRSLQQRSEAQALQDRSLQQRPEAQALQDRSLQQRLEAQVLPDRPLQQRPEAQALHDRPLQQRSEAQATQDRLPQQRPEAQNDRDVPLSALEELTGAVAAPAPLQALTPGTRLQIRIDGQLRDVVVNESGGLEAGPAQFYIGSLRHASPPGARGGSVPRAPTTTPPSTPKIGTSPGLSSFHSWGYTGPSWPCPY